MIRPWFLRDSFLGACLAALLGASAFGQSVVVPNANATVVGGDSSLIPTTPISIESQFVFGSGQFTVPILITGLSFRAAPGTGPLGFTFSGSIYLSTSTNFPNTNNGKPLLSATFANNVGPDNTLVLSGSNITMSGAGCPVAGTTPCPWANTVVFTTPFLYNPANGALLFDAKLTSYVATSTGKFDLIDCSAPGCSIAEVNAEPLGTPAGSFQYGGVITQLTYAPVTTPSVCAGCVVNAASFAKDTKGNGEPVGPGSLVAIFTSALAASAATFTTAALPPSLSGVSVTFNNVPAPMVSVTPGGSYPFVSAQVPFEALSSGQTSASVPVVLTANRVASAPVQTPLVASAPGIFTIPPTGQGYGILVFVDPADHIAKIAAPTSASSTLGYPTGPIPRGTNAFFYAAGLGQMTPPVPDGSGTCPASNGLCNANSTPTVQIGGITAPVAFAGQAPGFPGVYQINIAIPQNAPTGNSVSLIMKSADGSVTSNTATIAVQ